ncbi:hypothetical protein HanXRQr2_Chr15g0671621 [Helianthus annuus]|uniref:Uncharacterized protein n=1 Tax=Helianthus annuus TaxID=4232 RepID=A0A9K3H2T8_HELAN|nr:hypothetical protein HanXRQr2_Chr15g0671621 [Helianthus annuus]
MGAGELPLKTITLVSSTHLHMNGSIWMMLYLKLVRLKYITNKERMGRSSTYYVFIKSLKDWIKVGCKSTKPILTHTKIYPLNTNNPTFSTHPFCNL